MKKLLWRGAVLLLPAALIITAAASCTRKIYVPMENTVISRDTLRSVVHTRDSLIMRDSVIMIRSGDTLQNTIIRERWRVRTLHDTIRDIRRDTVRLKETIIEEPAQSGVKRPGRLGNIFDTLFLSIGKGVIAALLIVAAVWILRRRADKQA